jgi:hypothetical protein
MMTMILLTLLAAASFGTYAVYNWFQRVRSSLVARAASIFDALSATHKKTNHLHRHAFLWIQAPQANQTRFALAIRGFL